MWTRIPNEWRKYIKESFMLKVICYQKKLPSSRPMLICDKFFGPNRQEIGWRFSQNVDIIPRCDLITVVCKSLICTGSDWKMFYVCLVSNISFQVIPGHSYRAQELYKDLWTDGQMVDCILFMAKSSMKTSSNGNIFRVTGHFSGEFTGHRWIPLIKASDAELWWFLWSAPE